MKNIFHIDDIRAFHLLFIRIWPLASHVPVNLAHNTENDFRLYINNVSLLARKMAIKYSIKTWVFSVPSLDSNMTLIDTEYWCRPVSNASVHRPSIRARVRCHQTNQAVRKLKYRPFPVARNIAYPWKLLSYLCVSFKKVNIEFLVYAFITPTSLTFVAPELIFQRGQRDNCIWILFNHIHFDLSADITRCIECWTNKWSTTSTNNHHNRLNTVKSEFVSNIWHLSHEFIIHTVFVSASSSVILSTNACSMARW